MTTEITSRQNSEIKRIASLKDKKYRKKYGEYLAEGIKEVSEAILSGQKISEIIGLKEVIRSLPECDAKLIETNESVIRFLSDTVAPQGVVAVIKIPDAKAESPNGNCAVLDGVKDPGNVGTIIRTCAALGIKYLYMCDCADPYSPKVVRSSMSGIYSVKISEGDREEIYSSIRGKCEILVADMGGENVFTANISKPYALVVGNEANGVSGFFKEKADKTVSVPMEKAMESLNAAVAFSVAAYTLYGKKFVKNI